MSTYCVPGTVLIVLHVFIHLFSKFSKLDTVIIPILQLRKLRHTEVKQIA